jgi:hypothetical protein
MDIGLTRERTLLLGPSRVLHAACAALLDKQCATEHAGYHLRGPHMSARRIRIGCNHFVYRTSQLYHRIDGGMIRSL